MSSEQLPCAQVVATHAGISQFAICMFCKFDGRNFTRSSRNLYWGTLRVHIVQSQPHQFRHLDGADHALFGVGVLLVVGHLCDSPGVGFKVCPCLLVRTFVYI